MPTKQHVKRQAITRAKLRESLLAEYGPKCARCGAGWYLTVDHVVPKSKGGTNDLANLQLLCLQCNVHKAATVADYRIKPLPCRECHQIPRLNYSRSRRVFWNVCLCRVHEDEDVSSIEVVTRWNQKQKGE